MALAAVTVSDEFSAGSPFYGIPDYTKYNLDNIKVPLLLNFGELDTSKGFSDPESAKKLEKVIKIKIIF